jgi:hypothetical protein
MDGLRLAGRCATQSAAAVGTVKEKTGGAEEDGDEADQKWGRPRLWAAALAACCAESGDELKMLEKLPRRSMLSSCA